MKTKKMRKIVSLLLTTIMILTSVLSTGVVTVLAENEVTVSLSAKSGVYGNNFYADKMPEFNVKFTGAAGEYNVSYEAKNKYDETVWKKTDVLSIGSMGTAVDNISIDALYFGVIKLVVTVSQNGADAGCKTTYYTLSNHTSDMPKNERTGAASQVSWMTGTEDAHVYLLKDGGFGNLRSNDLGWNNIEVEKGKFSLVEDNVLKTDENKSKLDTIERIRKLLSGLNANDVNYIATLGISNTLYTTDGTNVFSGTDAEYARLKEYAKYLAEQTAYKIDTIEVTNEWHSPAMTGSEANSKNAGMFTDITNAVYEGVAEAENADKPKVAGIVEDAWGLYGKTPEKYGEAQNGMVPQYIDNMQSKGIKPYDVVSLHPYPLATEPFEVSIKSNAFVQDMKELLENEAYGENDNYSAPFIFTEIGWDNQDGITDEQQAAWLVRANAYIQKNDMAEVVCNYHMMDYTRNNNVCEMGLINSPSSANDFGVAYLGKESYTAMAYYNGLMSKVNQDAISDVELAYDMTDDYCYNFEPAEAGNERVLMYGLYTEDAEPVTKYLNVGTDKVKISDMHGNEREVQTADGVVEIVLDDTPDYVIGNFDSVSVADSLGEAAENTASYAKEDMEDLTKVQWMQNTPQVGGGIYRTELVAPDKGDALHIYSVKGEVAANKRVQPAVVLADEDRCEKAVISFDVLTEVLNQGYIQVLVDGKNKATGKDANYAVAGNISDNKSKVFLYNNWQTHPTGEAALDCNEWTRVDLVVDMAAENTVLYKNGVEILSGNKTASYPELEDIKKVYIPCYTETTNGFENGSYYIDNLTVTSIDSVTSKPADIKVWGKDTVYINMPQTLSADSKVSENGNFLEAADGTKISAKAELVGKTAVKLTLSEKMKDDVEYKVSFGGGTVLKDFLGNAYTKQIKINKTNTTMYEEVLNTSFDEDEWKTMTRQSRPENFEFDSSADNGDIIGATDPDDETNNVLKFCDLDDKDWTDRLKFKMSDMPDTKINFDVNYKIKFAKANETDLFGSFFIRLVDEDSTAAAGNQVTSGLSVNYQPTSDPVRGIDYYTGNSPWANNGPVALVENSSLDMSQWYTYNHEYTFEENETYIRPKANYSVWDKDNNTVVEVFGVQTCNTTVDWVNEIQFDYMSVDNQADDAAYIDDLYVGYSYQNMAEPQTESESKREAVLMLADGSESMLTSSIDSDVLGVRLKLSDKPEGAVSAKLDNADVELTRLADDEYTFTWQNLENRSYTLRVYDGENTIFTYSFVMDAEKSYEDALLVSNKLEEGVIDINQNGKAGYEYVKRDDFNKNTFYVKDNGDSTNDAVYPRFYFNRTVSGKKVLVSFDIKADSAINNAEFTLNMLSETKASEMALILKQDGEVGKNWLFNNWNPGYIFKDNVISDTWNRVDYLLDLDKHTAAIYLNGSLIKSENDVYNTIKSDEASGIYMRVTEGLYIDNVQAIELDSYAQETINTIKTEDNVLKSELAIALGEAVSGDIKLINRATSEEINATVTGFAGDRYITITAEKSIDATAQYTLSLGETKIVDVSGNIMADNTALALVSETIGFTGKITLNGEVAPGSVLYATVSTDSGTKDMVVMIALYDENGSLVEVSTPKAGTVDSKNELVSEAIIIVDEVEGYSAKAICVDSLTNLKPIFDVADITW